MADDLEALYRAPLAAWVAERKSLAAAIKLAGDRDRAAEVGKLPRPTPAAWAINQLWHNERALWERLVTVTRAVGKGDLAAAGEQRAVLAALRARAIALCAAVEQPATEATLAKLDTNLRALASHGWGDVPPGQLAVDLPPPGFDAMADFALVAAPVPAVPVPTPAAAARARTDDVARAAEAARADAARAEAARAADAARLEAQRAERARKVERLATARAAAAAARTRVSEAAAAVALARAELDRAELALADAQARAAAADREVVAATAAAGPDAP